MLRVCENGFCVALFHDPTRLHDHDFVCDRAHDRQIVTDKQVCQRAFAAQVGDQVQNLRTHRYVESRDSFVKDNQRGFDDQGARNSDALALPTLEFVNIFGRVGGC